MQTAAWAEACAVKYFLGRGFQVFTNVSGFGPVDLVAIKTRGKALSIVHLVDVKSTYDRTYGGLSLEQKWAKVRVLKVDPDGNCSLVPQGEERITLNRKEKKNEMDQQD